MSDKRTLEQRGEHIAERKAALDDMLAALPPEATHGQARDTILQLAILFDIACSLRKLSTFAEFR